MFSKYIENIFMNVFEWLATLVQFLTLIHKNLNIGYTCFGPNQCDCTFSLFLPMLDIHLFHSFFIKKLYSTSKNKWGLFKVLPEIVLNAFAWHAYTSFVLGYALTQLVMICMIMLDINGFYVP
jgi:hypothetical protein